MLERDTWIIEKSPCLTKWPIVISCTRSTTKCILHKHNSTKTLKEKLFQVFSELTVAIAILYYLVWTMDVCLIYNLMVASKCKCL